jgi:hypothetical protein
MPSKSIKVGDFVWLQEIWDSKNWKENENEAYVYERFCNIIPHLSQEQKQLIQELIENYLWINSREYEKRFNNIIEKLDSAVLTGCNTIYILPIIKPSDEKKTKSGNHCIYYLKGGIFSFNPLYENINLEVIEDYATFLRLDFKSDGSEVILLIDDFIGSGDTFDDAWTEIQKNPSALKTKLAILTLAIQEEAYIEIDKYGIPIYYSELRKKGISDSYQSPEKEEKIKIMEEIEDMIKPAYYSFGYKRSEALITLIRTPDNTFPFFWMRYPIRGTEFTGPFFRP